MVDRKNSGEGKGDPRREPTVSATEETVEKTLANMENLYRCLTGSAPPAPGDRPYAPIPVERDPHEFVDEQIETLRRALEGGADAGRGAPWTPSASVWENERELVLCVDLPGVRPQALDVALEGRLLTVSGHRPAKHDGHQLRLTEGTYGPFTRRFALPPRAVAAEAEAKLRDGILELRIAKRQGEVAGSRRVQVA